MPFSCEPRSTSRKPPIGLWTSATATTLRCISIGRLLFTGRSAYRERDPSFLGIIGYNDTVVLPLAKGHNELVVKVTEVFGGWGLMARWATPLISATEWPASGPRDRTSASLNRWPGIRAERSSTFPITTVTTRVGARPCSRFPESVPTVPGSRSTGSPAFATPWGWSWLETPCGPPSPPVWRRSTSPPRRWPEVPPSAAGHAQ